jgi:branched-chain amino acid transport system substrate-binding protein
MACFGDNAQAAAGAEYAHDALGARTAWLLSDDTTDYTILLARYFKERYTQLGGKIVGEDTYAGGTTDFAAQIQRIRALPSPPDMLYVSAGPDDIGPLVRQLRRAGIAQPIVGGDGYDTPLLLQEGGSRAHDVYFTTHAFLRPGEGTRRQRRFIAAYRARFGAPPATAFAALGFDAVMLAADAIRRAGSGRPTKVAAALESTRGFRAVTGTISFGPGLHIPDKEVTIVKAGAGRLTLAAVRRPQRVPEP